MSKSPPYEEQYQILRQYQQHFCNHFFNQKLTRQNSQRLYLLGRTSRRFLWCWLLLLFFTSLEVFSFHCFSTSSLTLQWLHAFYTFSPAHRHYNFSTLFIFIASATVLSGCFLPYTPSFVTQMRAWIPTPSRIFLCACPYRVVPLPAVAWTWTIDVWSTRPLIYQLRQWATKYRVKIELLNMFRLFKVMFKDY